MRKEPNMRVENYRLNGKGVPQSHAGKNHGIFQVRNLRVISSGDLDDDWEHVSVSTPSRTPDWKEMCKIKELFWRDDETVIQFHPKKGDYVNIHPHCLHLWRKKGEDIELPPRDYV
jgi:hypothetical protein